MRKEIIEYIYIFFLVVVFLFYLVVFEILAIDFFPEFFLWMSCFVLVSAYVFSFVIIAKKNKSIISLFLFFILSCFLFNCGQPFLYLLGLKIRHPIVFFNTYPDGCVIKSLWFQTCCLCGMTFGSLLCMKNIKHRENEIISFRNISFDKLNVVEFGFLLSTCFIVFQYLIMLKTRSTMNYMDYMFGGYKESSLLSLIRFSFFSFMFACLNKHKDRFWVNLIMICNFVVLLLMLLVGSRFKLVPVIAGSLFMIYSVKKHFFYLTKKKMFISVCLFICCFSLMRGWTFLRNVPLSSINYDMVVNIYSDGFISGFWDTLAECGSSIICLLSTMFFIDNFGVGSPTIFVAWIMSVIPYDVLHNLNLIPEIHDLARWVTNREGTNVGLGYSIFAEFYYNFASFGIFFAAFFGYVFSYLEKKTIELFSSRSIIDTLLAGGILYLIADAIFLSRGNMLLISTNLRYCMFLVVFNCFMKKK